MRFEERILTYRQRRSQSEGSTFISDEIAKLTIDVQLVDFGLNRHELLCLGRDKLAFNGLDQTRVGKVELDGEVGSVHLPSLAVRLVVYIFFSTTESGKFTSRSELIQLFGGYRCEVDEP